MLEATLVGLYSILGGILAFTILFLLNKGEEYHGKTDLGIMFLYIISEFLYFQFAQISASQRCLFWFLCLVWPLVTLITLVHSSPNATTGFLSHSIS